MRIAISAGEVSGERHLAGVIRALRDRNPAIEVRGMAGAECQKAGAELVVDCYRAGAAMGFSELLRSARSIFSSFSSMKALIKAWRPDLLILVDYPDFNLRLARVAHEAGVKVLYFIPPKVWAWRAGRVRLIAQYVDRVAAIFPFEGDFYKARGYDRVSYVGNPLLDRIDEAVVSQQREDVVLVLPGSRKFEVQRILAPTLRAVESLRRDYPALRARVLLAPNMSTEWVREIAVGAVSIETVEAVEWVRGDALSEMARARVGVLKSGTCNLEGALAGLPFISVYSGSYLSNIFVSLFVSLKEYSPVNILRSGTVQEVMQVKIDQRALEDGVRRLLSDQQEIGRVKQGLAEVCERLRGVELGGIGSQATTSVADRVASLALATAAG